MKLVATELQSDPRIEKAKQLLIEAVHDHQKKLTAMRQPHSDLKKQYADLVASFSAERGGKLWYPYIGSGMGNGALVELLDGSVKYDFISGIGVHYLGHSHPDLIASSVDAAISDVVMQGNLQQNGDAVELVSLLCKAANLSHCFLSASGATANENGLKVAFQKRFPANRVLAFDHCFAGRTLTLSQITDKPAFREGLPSNLLIDYVPFYDASNPEESTKQAVSALKQHIARYPKQHAVMCFELVQGEGGFYPGSNAFFTALMTILKENNISILIDEVQTFGRTPSLFAFQHFELEAFADIVIVGKPSAARIFPSHTPPLGLV